MFKRYLNHKKIVQAKFDSKRLEQKNCYLSEKMFDFQQISKKAILINNKM